MDGAARTESANRRLFEISVGSKNLVASWSGRDRAATFFQGIETMRTGAIRRNRHA